MGMEEKNFLVVYDYKGSSTDYYWETHNRFFMNEETMVSFLEHIDIYPNEHRFKNLYMCTFKRVKDKDVQAYRKAHQDIEEQKERVKQAKIKKANAKLRDALSDEDIDILKEAGVIS